jgi:ABC-type amino acid transport substrate-binding protein
MRLGWSRHLACLVGIVLSSLAYAQTTGGELVGTLKNVQASGVVAIGYRDASIPFSYLSAEKRPIGYSIDICQTIVAAMAEEVGRELTIRWVPVTADTRMAAVLSGQVDLECGSTTNNAERRKRVAFSPIIFVAGTKLMVRKDSPIKSFRDLAGKTVVVTAGTTNEATMRALVTKFNVNYKVQVAPDHADSYAQLGAGQADAFATDDVLLYGLIAKNKAQSQFMVVGDYLSYEPYGIMYRKDDVLLAGVVQRAFAEMAEAQDFEHTYDRWFLHRLPSGDRINLPMSPQLENIFASFGTHPE